MTLIAIILALLCGHILGDAEKILSFQWFNQLVNWLEKHLSAYRIWDSPAGILITVAIPLLGLAVLLYLLGEVLVLIPFVLSVIILYICLGYDSLDKCIERYNSAIADGSDSYIADAAADILNTDIYENSSDDFPSVLDSLFRQSNDRVFAVLFWFLVLGPFGALLYRLVHEVLRNRHDIHGPYTESAKDLFNILNWPSVRLTIVSYALVGSLIHTIEVWREQDDLSLQLNEDLLPQSGLAAIACNYPENEDDRENQQYCLEHAEGLIKRSIILWLTLIAFSTISGWLS